MILDHHNGTGVCVHACMHACMHACVFFIACLKGGTFYNPVVINIYIYSGCDDQIIG